MLAGVNGAGKSSVGGAALQQKNLAWFNPDTFARELRQRTGMDRAESDSEAWNEGKRRLLEAIATGSNFAFETTLGGDTIAGLLAKASATHDLIIWYCGLTSVDLHIERVRNRVAVGGHSIPDEKIRQRWDSSILNLVHLVSRAREIHVYDNSPSVGIDEAIPDPLRVALILDGRLIEPDPNNATALNATPGWARPVLAAALHMSWPHRPPQLRGLKTEA